MLSLTKPIFLVFLRMKFFTVDSAQLVMNLRFCQNSVDFILLLYRIIFSVAFLIWLFNHRYVLNLLFIFEFWSSSITPVEVVSPFRLML